MQSNLYTGNGLLYENYRRGLENRYDEDDFRISISISAEPIKITIYLDDEEENNDVLRPLFRKAV